MRAGTQPAYVAIHCPVQTYFMLLHTLYGMSGIDLRYAATRRSGYSYPYPKPPPPPGPRPVPDVAQRMRSTIPCGGTLSLYRTLRSERVAAYDMKYWTPRTGDT
eukprot:3877179-Rhodomonas_salina.1